MERETHVYISRETRFQSHERLREVIGRAELTVLAGTYAFDEFPIADLAHLSPEALAYVRDDHVWSRLVPCSDAARELFTVFRFHFARDLDNSGFVGWLASMLKEKVGTGVFVVCGQNSREGGIFDYWGCPAEIGEEALDVVRSLASKPSVADASRPVPAAPSLDGVRMRPVATSDQGTIDRRTTFDFSQDGAMVSARYAGGSVHLGHLVGTRRDNVLAFCYVQLEDSGRIETGHSTGEITMTSEARIRLVEHFTWDSRGGSGTNTLEESTTSLKWRARAMAERVGFGSVPRFLQVIEVIASPCLSSILP